MKKTTLSLFTILLLTLAFGQPKLKGTFIGVEAMKDYSDPSNPKYKWYHLSALTFKGDSVFLEQSPIAIYKMDTIFSASDGGFYSYAGTIGKYEGKPFLDLKLKSCDYCPRKFMKFTPPKIVKDEDSTQNPTGDTTAIEKTTTIEYPNRDYKIMVLQTTNNNDVIIIDKNIYRRQKRK
jgi:hypothetical protein